MSDHWTITREARGRRIEPGDPEERLAQIQEAFDRVRHNRDLVIIEGAGHAAVGSTLGISNALVAQRLGAKVVLVTTRLPPST